MFHNEWRRHHGPFLDERIHHLYFRVGKTRSLKGILEPFSTQGNLDMMARAGFVDIMTVQKYLSFEGFLAIK